jgi:hypothetical protein
MFPFLIGTFASLLPERYRTRIQTSSASALISAVLQFVVCLGCFVFGFLNFSRSEVFGGTTTALHAMEVGGDSALAGSGIFVLMEYMIRPTTLLLVYFLVEGIVRGVAAFLTGEIVPTMPLAVMAWLHGKLSYTKAERALGERVPDAVEALESPDVSLRIHSCRPKERWDPLMTIFYKDEMYEVAEEERGDLPRRFIYLLRRKPDDKIVRGIHHYDPNEVLLKE